MIIIGIWLLSSQTILPRPKGILGFDKLQHFIAYTGLAFTTGLWFAPDLWRRRPRLSFLITTALASIYGIIDEAHQYFVPGRDCNVWDWIADTLGAALGAFLLMLIVRCLVKGKSAAKG